MAENVTFFGDVADSFDALVAYDEKQLDSYVEAHGYSLGSMALASTTIAFMRFAQTLRRRAYIVSGGVFSSGMVGGRSFHAAESHARSIYRL